MEKNLKDKAVDIKGKQYVLVSDRILYLSDKLEGKYSIETDYKFIEPKMFICKATLTIGDCKYTGHAQETIGDGYINKTSALENCETSAVGRACAMAGIGVIDSISSVDEIIKEENKTKELKSNDLTDNILEAMKPALKAWREAGKSNDEMLTGIKAKYKVNKEMEKKILNLVL